MSKTIIFLKMEFPFVVPKTIRNFGNSHVFFTFATKKVLNFRGIPNEKCGKSFWDSHVFFRGCASNFWNSPRQSVIFFISKSEVWSFLFKKLVFKKKNQVLLLNANNISVSTCDSYGSALRLVWTMDFFMFTIFEISWFLSARGSVLQVQAKMKVFS